MQLHIEPDIGIEMPPDDNLKLSDFAEKAAAACATAEFLDLDTEPTTEDKETAAQTVYNLAENPVKGNSAALQNSKKFKAPVYVETKRILDAYSLKVVDNATQIRLMVTNKLIIESENEDPKIRLRALELLGKITDVGLFTEKSEVTVNHRSSADLVATLKEKIHKMMYPEATTQDAEIIEVNGEQVDIDKELGLDMEKEMGL